MLGEEMETAPAKASRKGTLLTVVIVAGLMVVEGVAIVAAVKFLGGADASPAVAAAGTRQGLAPQAADARVEVPICELDAFNKKEGPLSLYHIRVTAVARKTDEKALRNYVEDRKNTIEDRIATVIRRAEPKYLNEPGLETIRRQIKFQLDKIIGDENVIQELLIPKLLQSQGNL